MMIRAVENNSVTISGVIEDEFRYSHRLRGENFYTSILSCQRRSGVFDYIPITISENVIDPRAMWGNCNVKITGTFRSYTKHTDNGNHLLLSVYADQLVLLSENDNSRLNQIHLDGFICKAPIYKETPLGRELAEFMLAVHRPYKKSDYIPCIVWGKNSRYAKGLAVGDYISLDGRIQSREYKKVLDENTVEIRTAYEVSGYSIKKVGEEDDE